jgi:hypothetical protein
MHCLPREEQLSQVTPALPQASRAVPPTQIPSAVQHPVRQLSALQVELSPPKQLSDVEAEPTSATATQRFAIRASLMASVLRQLSRGRPVARLPDQSSRPL